MKTNDLAGRRFGRLAVLGDSGERKNGCILWRCRCDCGGEISATRRQLESGAATSCGCEKKPPAPKTKAEDLAGRQFGALTVLRRAPNDAHQRTRWLCRCQCGNVRSVPAVRLKSGHTKSCGCLRGVAQNRRDLSGRRFGRLTAIAPAEGKKGAWHCRCDCGNEVDVLPDSLLRGRTRSCGCLNREVSRGMHAHMRYQDGTCIEMLERAQKNWAENQAGFRGLFLTKKGKYRASITFRKAHFTLGYFNTFDEAVKARLSAEQALHAGYIEAAARYERHAAQDPQWAEQNPFYYDVSRDAGDFRVSTNG